MSEKNAGKVLNVLLAIRGASYLLAGDGVDAATCQSILDLAADKLGEVYDDMTMELVGQIITTEGIRFPKEASHPEEDRDEILTRMRLERGQDPKEPFNNFAVGTLGMHPDEVGMEIK